MQRFHRTLVQKIRAFREHSLSGLPTDCTSPARRASTRQLRARPRMPTRTLPGTWSMPHLSGGCPQHATWRSNPQYTLEPLATASYELSLRQPPARNNAIGMVVLHGAAASVAAEAGPLQAAALVGKSAWKASPVQTLTVQLEAGQSYRVVRWHGQSFLTRSRPARQPTGPPAHRPTASHACSGEPSGPKRRARTAWPPREKP